MTCVYKVYEVLKNGTRATTTAKNEDLREHNMKIVI